MVGAREDREELQDQNADLIKMRVAWTKEHPETGRTAGPIITDERAKLADCPVDQYSPAEWELGGELGTGGWKGILASISLAQLLSDGPDSGGTFSPSIHRLIPRKECWFIPVVK